jgi:hypothetical protein
MELNELQQQRADKLIRLQTAGIAGYPARAHRSHTISAVSADFDALMEHDTSVTVVGRVVGARRIMGKLAFAHIEDEHGRIQLWLSRADLGDEWFERFANDIDTFDIVQATGSLRRTKAGEASVFVTAMALLSKAINPPPDKWHGLTRCRSPLARALSGHDCQPRRAPQLPHPCTVWCASCAVSSMSRDTSKSKHPCFSPSTVAPQHALPLTTINSSRIYTCASRLSSTSNA